MLLIFILSISGKQLAKCGLLIDRASPIYLNTRLKALPSVIIVFDMLLYKLCPIGVKENISKERGTYCSHEDADDVDQCALRNR